MQGDFLIKDWLVQPQTNTVEKGSRRWHLEPKVMQVLVQLAQHSDQVLSKERLIETVWRDTFVGDDVLIRCISEIRYVFGDDARSPSIILTVPKSGYRLIAPVTMPMEASEPLIATSEQKYSSDKGIAVVDTALLEESVPAADEVVGSTSVANLTSTPEPPLTKTHATGAFRRSKLLVFIALLTVFLASSAFLIWRFLHPDPFTAFWQPILDTPEPVLFCIADQNQYSFITLLDAEDPSRRVILKDNLSAVVIDDLDTIVRVAAALRSHGKNYLLKGEAATGLPDLRANPAVFIGAFDNAWTLRLTRQLRFYFANNADMTQFRIVDAKNPAAMNWSIDRTQQLATNNYKDYAIVARFIDANTGRLAIVIAGIGRGGTLSGGEFLTNPVQLAQLVAAIKANGNKPNFEVVLSTQIIDGHPGAPRMDAAYFW